MKKTIVRCPNCGTQFEIAQHEYTTIATVIGEDSGLGVINLKPKAEQNDVEETTPNVPRSTHKLEEMKRLGMPVDNFFAISNPEVGIDFIMKKREDGTPESFTAEQIDSLIQDYISTHGHISNNRLFRRWIMAQVYHHLAHKDGFLAALRQKGYDYSWEMLIRELSVLSMLRLRDREAWDERKVFFSKDVIVRMAEHHIAQLHTFVDGLPTRRCKRRPYKRILGQNIFTDNIQAYVFAPLERALEILKHSTAKSILANTKAFYDLAAKFSPRSFEMSYDFENAYKAAGGYFTLKNLLMFHGVHLRDDDNNVITDVDAALAILKAQAIENCAALEGYKLLGKLKAVTEDNHFDYESRMRQLGCRK